jgi:hypothetical protein
MSESVESIAEERLQAALDESRARDPRKFYEERLSNLSEKDVAAYREAVSYYESRLIPAVAASESDPLGEWLEYGRVLATLSAAGKTVQIDPTGRSSPYARPVAADHLVLHLPATSRDAALPVGLPPQLSPAQRAVFDLLVNRKFN